MFSAQVGKTEGAMNVIGYYIQHDPAPILSVLEDEGKAEDWSKNRLSGLLTETPCMRGLVRSSRGRDSENTMTYKAYPGGYLAIAGAGSESDLTSRPIRVLICDEVDKWKQIRAGDPEELASNRQITFRHRAKTLRVSTPRDKGLSRIEAAYFRSDQRRYQVPCPLCGEYQVLTMGRKDDPFGLKFERTEEEPRSVSLAWYECEHCRGRIEHKHKRAMIARGKWVAEAPFNGHAGFSLNVLYSPWVTWANVADKFLQSKDYPDKLKVFINEWLAETWAEHVDKINEHVLYGRREEYGPQVPHGAGVLTAGIDIQDNRIEASCWAWGCGEEAWLQEHHIIYGDPTHPGDDSWAALDDWLKAPRYHQCGKLMQIQAAFVDAGAWIKTVAAFCSGKQGRRIFAIKGEEGTRKQTTQRPRRKPGKIDLVIVSVDMIKTTLNRRIRIAAPPEGEPYPPGFVHFPIEQGADLPYFEQLTAEIPQTKYKNGHPYRVWTLPSGRRCEAWDCFVYAYGALDLLKIRDIGRFVDKYAGENVIIIKEPAEDEEAAPVQSFVAKTNSIKRSRRRGGWVNRW